MEDFSKEAINKHDYVINFSFCLGNVMSFLPSRSLCGRGQGELQGPFV